MTEDEYQAIIIPLRKEMEARVVGLVDYLVGQPAKRLALDEARTFAWWCLSAGAEHAPAIVERNNRKRIAQHGAA